MEEIIMVMVTVGTESQGLEIGRSLVQEKLAACVNLIKGVKSLYIWEGRLSDDQEILMLIKTRRSLFSRLRDRVEELHTYEVPEIIALPVIEGSPSYLRWVAEMTGP
ncbi:MAG: divalent-cation tolerance protein CutA [Deltaproteobacteria bacterium]|nr:divalent-cation tolerance protein CutA [Deltaproteobacteria bacterium]MBW2305903.1 divalent-cation tolerance protein CutA [Deltaproteobacteria bacterium]